MSAIAERDASHSAPAQFKRLYALALSLGYLWALIWTYEALVSPRWNYIGFTYKWPGQDVSYFAVFSALAPSLILPMSVKQVRDFSVWILYFALYVPVTIIPPIMGNISNGDAVTLIAALLTSFLIVSFPSRPLEASVHDRLFTVTEPQFWNIFSTIYFLLNLYVFATFGSHLHLVSFADVYAQRDLAGSIQETSFVGYAVGVLYGAFNPFLMSYGLNRRRYGPFAVGAIGQVFLFATAAAKSVLLSDFIILGLFLLVFRRRPYKISRIGLAVASASIGLAIVGASLDNTNDGILATVFSLVYMRTFGMVGMLMGTYAEFFLKHPLTYFSHIGIVQNFVRYPYSDALGNVIGNFLIPDTDVMDANASYLATDGMAALGFPGIVLSGFLLRLILWMFDKSTSDKTLAIACCAIVPVLISVVNASMFTTLTTNGGAALIIILYTFSHAVGDDAKPESREATVVSLAGP